MTTHLFLQAADVWLFRDGKPFDVGTDNRARSLFPPNPETLQGALRSAELMRRGISLSDYAQGPDKCRDPQTRAVAEVVGWPGDYGQLRLVGPWLAHENGNAIERLFPLPADLVKESENTYHLLAPLEKSPFITNTPPDVQLLWRSGPPVSEKPDKEVLVAESGLRKYLAGELKKIASTQGDDLFKKESRFGVAVDSQRQCYREGQLFQIEYVRPKAEVGLSVLVDGLEDWPVEGFLALGGDARAALYRQAAPLPPLPTEIPGQQFKVYFTTPAYLQNGWQPANWAPYFDGPVTLVAAALGRPAMIGGWDLVKRWPKPLRRYVPAGSVFYFQAQGDVIFKNVPLTENGAEIGYGHICISSKEWNYV